MDVPQQGGPVWPPASQRDADTHTYATVLKGTIVKRLLLSHLLPSPLTSIRADQRAAPQQHECGQREKVQRDFILAFFLKLSQLSDFHGQGRVPKYYLCHILVTLHIHPVLGFPAAPVLSLSIHISSETPQSTAAPCLSQQSPLAHLYSSAYQRTQTVRSTGALLSDIVLRIWVVHGARAWT